MNVVMQKKKVFSQCQNTSLHNLAHFLDKRKHLENEITRAECSVFHAASASLFCFSNSEMYALVKR
jgi:hypothetical protein